MSNDGITIVFPAVDDDVISQALRVLTQHLVEAGHDASGGMLGGEYGYGAWYENDVFMMHPFCWCMKADCEWCNECLCDVEECALYFVDGKPATFDAWMKADWGTTRSEPVPEKQCDRCREGREAAPNFLFKPTGATVHWYKYIGRGMEVDGDFPNNFLQECVFSIEVAS